MRELLTWLEGSGLGYAMRSAGVWSYGVANLIHILGVATLFGSVLVLDLRLLGVMVGEGAICATYIFAGTGLWNLAKRLVGL